MHLSALMALLIDHGARARAQRGCKCKAQAKGGGVYADAESTITIDIVFDVVSELAQPSVSLSRFALST